VFLWSSVRVAKHECYFVLQQQQQVLPCQHDGFHSIALTKINRLTIRNSSFELINYWINFLSQLKVTKSSLSIPTICKMDQDIEKIGVVLLSPSDDKKHASLCWAWIIILIKKIAINFSCNFWYTRRDWNSNENAKYWRKKNPQEITTIWPWFNMNLSNKPH
jgi:hypothetical protein